MDRLFFQLLRIVLGYNISLDNAPTQEQWSALYQMAVSQTLVGVLYPAIERLPEEQRPPKDVLLQWYMMKERVILSNRLQNKRAVETMEFFHQNGFECCILKGQGVATLYPNPLLRTSGDIDIWLSGGRDRIYDFARQKGRLEGLTYIHIHYPLYTDVEVEVHTTPGHMFAPLTNRRLQHYFKNKADEQFKNEISLPEGVGYISAPTDEFNRVYILLHIYGHLFGEGIGLRQVLDYYYVLRQSATDEEKIHTIRILKELGMLRFTRAMMWVQQEVFGLENEYLLVEPDEAEGRFLLSEIMQSGNFGKYDARIDRKNHLKLLARVLNSMRRNWKFLVRYPHEIIWDIPFRLWQYGWSRLTS